MNVSGFLVSLSSTQSEFTENQRIALVMMMTMMTKVMMRRMTYVCACVCVQGM